MFKQAILLFLILIAFGCNSPADSPYDSVVFVKKAVMSETGRASAVAFVIADKGYTANFQFIGSRKKSHICRIIVQ